MITDPWPRSAKARRAYVASDERPPLPLPPAGPLRAAVDALEASLKVGEAPVVRREAHILVTLLSDFYRISIPLVRVLGVRPHTVRDGVCTYQLFGDYTPETERIRVWMRTAMRAQVTTHKALLNTLLHELCHHIDSKLWSSPESPHTRGFFGRIDNLYHHALGTPAGARGKLHWVKSGNIYRLDWTRSRAARTNGSAPTSDDNAQV